MVFMCDGYKFLTFARAGFPSDNGFKVNVFNMMKQNLLLISSFLDLMLLV